jgi:hypothetical protein
MLSQREYAGEGNMFTLKVVFVILLCAPLIYLAVLLLEKLCDGALNRHKGQNG